LALDIINAALQLIGSAFILVAVKKTLRNRSSASNWWATNAYFLGWSIFNLFMWPSMGFYWSTIAAIWIIVVQLWYTILLFRFRAA
jgi:hypothetical protein